jgi:mycothiol synthase
MGEEDIAAVASLVQAAREADGHSPLGEHKWLDLAQGGRAGFAGFVARSPDRHRIVGYAQLSRGETSWAIEFVVHPSMREPAEHVGDDLLAAALAEIAAQGGGHVHLWVPKPDERADAIALGAGLRRGRELLQLRRALPLEEALRVRPRRPTRTFRLGVDEKAWLVLNNAAFFDHPEQGDWDLETLRAREALDWFDPEGFLLADDGDELAAFCWTKVHADEDPPIGEIYVIGVSPEHQGRGLGAAMLSAGLEHLGDLGLAGAMLYVDADNEPARALYARFGFATDHIDRAYVGDVAST